MGDKGFHLFWIIKSLFVRFLKFFLKVAKETIATSFLRHNQNEEKNKTTTLI